jgi:hypothetical protein
LHGGRHFDGGGETRWKISHVAAVPSTAGEARILAEIAEKRQPAEPQNHRDFKAEKPLAASLFLATNRRL